ncbi:MAG TPA: energy transducer TonB [Cellvibrionales bacterium]|nr:energy transducer TonB [Cellvibrionales bacterium]
MKTLIQQLRLLPIAAVVALSFNASSSLAQESAKSLDELLEFVKQGQVNEAKENKAREARFLAEKTSQAKALSNAKKTRTEEEKRSTRLEKTFDENKEKITIKRAALNEAKGSLNELFGHINSTAGDMRENFNLSLVSSEYPNRGEFLTGLIEKLKGDALPTIEEIERVWFEMQREMTEAGKVTTFKTDVVEAGGEKVNKSVVRVGPFALVADGKYLEYNGVTGTVSELVRQPADRYMDSAAELQASSGELVQFGIDPTGGSILGLLVQAPNLQERVEQGGVVGYIILIVGAFGLLLALERLVTLTLIRMKVNKQLKSKEVNTNNPLGRVLKVRDEHPDADVEALELHLTEAILGEEPKLGRNLTIIKIISVVAPLMGLLGTVTGMINTFQAITLFGTGDPKLMAGGISTALVTTVLGLVVAIPMTLLYAMLNTRSKNIVYILQEQASGVIAERAERG